jgi:hypothetical protein
MFWNAKFAVLHDSQRLCIETEVWYWQLLMLRCRCCCMRGTTVYGSGLCLGNSLKQGRVTCSSSSLTNLPLKKSRQSDVFSCCFARFTASGMNELTASPGSQLMQRATICNTGTAPPFASCLACVCFHCFLLLGSLLWTATWHASRMGIYISITHVKKE